MIYCWQTQSLRSANADNLSWYEIMLSMAVSCPEDNGSGPFSLLCSLSLMV